MGNDGVMADVAQRVGADLLTVGVEEEFLLVDPHTGAAVPAVDLVIEQVPPELRGQVEREFQTSQIEIGSPPGLELVLDPALPRRAARRARRRRRAGRRPAARHRHRPGGRPGARRWSTSPRFDRMVERFRLLVPGPGNNGMHVHVGVPDPETGVQVLNHVRPWLPMLHAVDHQLPLRAGRGHRLRQLALGRVGTLAARWRRRPWLESHEHYQRLIRQLIASGMMLDEGMLYWYARLSAKYPTVEIRIGDVCPSVDDAVLVAALVRALVATAMDDIAADRPAPRPTTTCWSRAHWRAAHDGLEGDGVDLTTGELRPAWDLLDRLVDRVRPALERHGDLDRGDRPARPGCAGTAPARRGSARCSPVPGGSPTWCRTWRDRPAADRRVTG